MLDSMLNKICVLQVATEATREAKGTGIQPFALDRVVENSEAKAEELKAVLEAMGSGGLQGVARMLAKLLPTPIDCEKTPRRDEVPSMELHQATPPMGGSSTLKAEPEIVVKQEKEMLALEARPSRNVESPAPLTEVGSGFFSRDQANVMPVGSGTNFKAVASATSRGTAAKDKEQAKLGRPGYDYSDYFAPESWPFVLRAIAR